MAAAATLGLAAGPGAGRAQAEPRGGADRDARPEPVSLFLCGDVMTGRGIDQVLPHPNPPEIYEPYVRSAEDYVRLAERASGPVPERVGFDYVWGDALEELRERQPDLRIINLETSITTSGDPAPKGINYRMHPANVGCLLAAGLDCCVLANNHVLDWGEHGLLETLDTLDAAGLPVAGAGRTREDAAEPAVLSAPGRGRVLVYAFAHESSGVPDAWAAGRDRPGVNVLEDLAPRTVARIAERVQGDKRPGDVAVASIHWGSNWGYRVPTDHADFAHRLIDEAAIDLIHGHSSHHPRPIEVYRDKLILYGCGDFLNDYEGITGYEQFRGDLALMYFPRLDPATGALRGLEMTAMRIRKLRLNHADDADATWLAERLDQISRPFGTSVRLTAGNRLEAT